MFLPSVAALEFPSCTDGGLTIWLLALIVKVSSLGKYRTFNLADCKSTYGSQIREKPGKFLGYTLEDKQNCTLSITKLHL